MVATTIATSAAAGAAGGGGGGGRATAADACVGCDNDVGVAAGWFLSPMSLPHGVVGVASALLPFASWMPKNCGVCVALFHLLLQFLKFSAAAAAAAVGDKILLLLLLLHLLLLLLSLAFFFFPFFFFVFCPFFFIHFSAVRQNIFGSGFLVFGFSA